MCALAQAKDFTYSAARLRELTLNVRVANEGKTAVGGAGGIKGRPCPRLVICAPRRVHSPVENGRD